MLYNVNFFRFSQILLNLACTSVAHHETFVPAPLIAYLITLSLEKRKYCFGKSLGFWIQISLRTVLPKQQGTTLDFLFFLSCRHYCPAGTTVTIPCKKGTYGPTEQLGSQAECKGCDPGEYCAIDGLNQTTGNCSSGYFCKQNASVSEPTDGTTGKYCNYC